MDSLTQQRILDGDLDAYGKVVRAHQDMLLGYALRRLGDWTLAEEMVQLTFIRAYQRLADFRPGEELGIWLCVTCKYLILTELEKKQRETSHLSNYREQLAVEIATAAATDNEPDMRTEQLAKLRACVDKLGQETAELVTLRYLAIPIATIFGYLIWDEIPSSKQVLGGLIVISSCLLITYREMKKR